MENFHTPEVVDMLASEEVGVGELYGFSAMYFHRFFMVK